MLFFLQIRILFKEFVRRELTEKARDVLLQFVLDSEFMPPLGIEETKGQLNFGMTETEHVNQ